MLRIVIDTNVLIAARRSRSGASNELLRRVLDGQLRLLATVPLFIEYESVLKRPEHLLHAGLTEKTVSAFLDLLAGHVEEIKLHYIWRPQLNDPSDEMVLEAAINGRADHIVTFNERHFSAASKFGIGLATPAAILRTTK
jgi:putative PIN family toxin of toxin-antitoxin system